MRIPRSWVYPMAVRIVKDLTGKGLVEPATDEDELVRAVDEILLDELTVEDRLNEEVKEILSKFSSEIEGKRLDYKRLFDLTKRKLVKERNIIL